MKKGEWTPVVLIVAGFALMAVAFFLFGPSLGLLVFLLGFVILVGGFVWGSLVYKWDWSIPGW